MAQQIASDGWQDFSLPCGRGVLSGKSRGDGPHLILCIHGYGNDRHLFDDLVANLPAKNRLVSIELPFFGGSEWPDDPPISQKDLREIWSVLATHFPHTERNLLCFSLGAKLGLGMAQADPALLHRVVLIAPDGLHPHPMYRFCIYHPLGRRLFKWVIKTPRFFLFVLRTLYKLKIADAFKYRFVQNQFADDASRARLKRVWFGFSEIRPHHSSFAQWEGVEWHLFWGKKDQILPPAIGERFVKQVPGAHLHLLDAGHLVLKSQRGMIKAQLESIFES